jgi:hypothetical protein
MGLIDVMGWRNDANLNKGYWKIKPGLPMVAGLIH